MKGKKIVSYDFYIVRAASYLTNYDRKVILRLYQPICGFGAISLFFTLWSEVDNKAMITSKRKHESILETTGCTIDEFERFRNSLEAIGLMKTYLAKSDDGSDVYYYELYSPISADKFLTHELYGTLLRQKISMSHMEECVSYFKMNNEIEEAHVDISHSFKDVYILNFDDTDALKRTLNSYENIDAKNTSLSIQSAFSMPTFYAYLRTKQINKSVVSKELIELIKLESAMYNLDEEQIATILSKCIKMDGIEQKVDLDKFKKNCAKNKILFDDDFSAIASHKESKKEYKGKDALMNEVTPEEFLTYRQDNKAPTSTDLALIRQIKEETHLDNPVINVLLDFVLIKKENTLPKAYTMTLATNLRNNNVRSIEDAKLYLKSKEKYLSKIKENKKMTPVTDAVREDNLDLEEQLKEFRRLQEELKKGGKA